MGRLLRIDLSLGFGREPFSPVVRAGFVRWEAPSLPRRTLASDQARVAMATSKSDATIYAPIMHNYIYQLPYRWEEGVSGAADLRQTADRIRHSAAPDRQFIDALADRGRRKSRFPPPAVVIQGPESAVWWTPAAGSAVPSTIPSHGFGRAGRKDRSRGTSAGGWEMAWAESHAGFAGSDRFAAGSPRWPEGMFGPTQAADPSPERGRRVRL